MRLAVEKIVEAHVGKFVEKHAGRFKEHCSDVMLLALLMHEFKGLVGAHRQDTRVEDYLDGDPNAAYATARPIFETVLEYTCRACVHGHHLAQEFGEHMEKSLPIIKAEIAALSQPS